MYEKNRGKSPWLENRRKLNTAEMNPAAYMEKPRSLRYKAKTMVDTASAVLTNAMVNTSVLTSMAGMVSQVSQNCQRVVDRVRYNREDQP
jgi:hypothetical protein